MTYEVRVYKTLSDYAHYSGALAIDGITRKREALREGRQWLSDYDVVKVQSDDREFIRLLMSETARLGSETGEFIGLEER